MNHKLFCTVLLVIAIAMILSSCASSPPEKVPMTKAVPTVVSTMAPVVPVTPNDATHARLRLAPLVLGGPYMDLFVNGTVVVNGGQEQVNIPDGYITAYLFLMPGTYSVAVVPTGKGLANAILGPLDVTLVGGHRYTLAMLGQPTDQQFQSLVIDETEALHKVRTSVDQNILFVVNNLVGTTTINFAEDGHGPHGVMFGGFDAAPIQVGRHKNLAITANGDPKASIDGGLYDRDSELPGSDSLIGLMGNFTGVIGNSFDVAESAPTSELNTIDFLQGFGEVDFESNGKAITFNIFLSAIKTARLTDVFTSGKPLLVLAPTDDAFAALPKETLDALMADPKALVDLVHNHVVEEYVPRGSLAKTPGGGFDRTFTNMLGTQIVIGGEYSVNGTNVGGMDSIFIANGTQVHPITNVLLPVN
jgi:uncharacterized surface protein with fasciclin (FAS1) repeats